MLDIFKTISLTKNQAVPLYAQLYEKLKGFILDGTLLPDSRIPAIRQLVQALGINQVTVVSAYRQLENEGYIYTIGGSGTFVSRLLPSTADTNQPGGLITDELYHPEDLSLISNGKIKIGPDTIDFASATPTPDLFPVDDFKIALNEVLERDKGNAFGYQESQGFYPLRECISGVLHQSIKCSPDNIQIISGAQQGIDIISKMFLRQGDHVITESPTYTGAVAVFKSRGAEIADIELEEDGPNLNILEYSLKKYRPKFIYTIPSFQNPTGYSYSNEKRRGLLKLAERYNTYIIEDDYVSDLDFNDRCYVPLKAMDNSGRVILIKSFSKIFMPGLRLGFMIAPANLQENILEAKHTTDISTSGLIQRAFDLYIRKGFWDKHFNFMYGIYKERYLKTTDSLDMYLRNGISYSKPGGGLNLWLNLPYGTPVGSLFKTAAASGVVFAPGKIFYSSNTPQKLNNIRLSFAAVHAEHIEKGIMKLCEIYDDLSKNNGTHKSMPIL